MKTEFHNYQDGKTLLEGYFARPQDQGRSFPLVLVSHAWSGRDDIACKKAEELAKLGYASFALDMFGKGVLGYSPEENAKLIKPFMDDRRLLLQRIQAALNFAKTLPQIDLQRIAVIGFCFGGLCALDLARSGAAIQGVVSFHGLLNRPEKLPTQSINAKILALHGYADPLCPAETLTAFQQEMELSAADWQIHIYGHTQHAFTNPHAKDTQLGLIYNPIAERRSWQSMKNFFQEIFE